MMGKNSTISQIDFLLLEEVSDKAAETISGGKLTLGGSQELELGLYDPLTMPIDALVKFMDSVGTLTGILGIDLPKPKLPDPKSLLPEMPT